MAEKILGTQGRLVKSLELKPGTGGCFEVQVNGKLIYSKLSTGEFPDEQAIVSQIQDIA